ncbi:hypothetical protein PRZ48_011986 [Zasmidium cellare]|uniref:Pkr1-domain-containing protein n=1 Tax=Zasmidium cellare TaxID=395010 RepID=A0ABR0E839_ZASCE|nr:hypothetical protein PRZ48_011986 [Zasmidium cellare]
MADFLSQLWESVFTAGPTPTLLVATNVTFGALQVLLAGLLFATYSIHFAILSVLCGGLWYSINWFAAEIAAAQAKEVEAERIRKKNAKAGASSTAEDEGAADDEGEDTEVETDAMKASTISSGSWEPSKEDERVRKEILDAMKVSGSSGAKAAPGDVRKRQGKVDDGNQSASEISTDSEWEKVDEKS